jgi:hypothetical protein
MRTRASRALADSIAQVRAPDGGFDVQRLDGKRWGMVKQFPWAACPAR